MKKYLKLIVLLKIFLIIGVTFLPVLHISLSKKKETIPVGKIHYLLHKFYAISEPSLIRIFDYLITSKFIISTASGKFIMKFLALLGYFLPHGIVTTTERASILLHNIEKNAKKQGGQIAVGPCVCQYALNKYVEPVEKDIVILYGADIYMHLEMGYRLISADEATDILKKCHEKNLVHSVEFCMHSHKWTFVICNCDSEICVVTRTYKLVKRFLYAGPDIVSYDKKKCSGFDNCGKCVDVCMFDANKILDEHIIVDYDACLGCGQCVFVCQNKSRHMIERENFSTRGMLPIEFFKKE